MTVNSSKQAWIEADRIFPTDYEYDSYSSAKAGYAVYRSTSADHYYCYICDLGNRLEVNIENETVNIWIAPVFSEYKIADALSVISDAIYEIDDKVDSKLAEKTGIAAARTLLYAAYDKLADELRKTNPDSSLFKKYNM